MADTVAVRTIANTPDRLVVHLTNVSDGTGESAVIKVDKSTFIAADGAEPDSLDIEKIVWCCDGMQARLLWDHTADDLAVVLSGSGSVDFRSGVDRTNPADGTLKDPRSAGGTGDLLLTTSGHTAGDTYNVTLWLRKNPN